nr:hypothetical protein [Thermovirga lienii]
MIKIKLLLIYQREGWLSCFKPSILHHHNGHYWMYFSLKQVGLRRKM